MCVCGVLGSSTQDAPHSCLPRSAAPVSSGELAPALFWWTVPLGRPAVLSQITVI